MTLHYRREAHEKNTEIVVNGTRIGGREIAIIAGPCAIESEEQMLTCARAVQKYGANILRGGAYKPRANPYSFEGLGEKGLEILAKAGKETGLPTITEILDPRDIELIEQYVDIIQVGARNMQNVALLKELGKSKKPILLKRGMAATVTDLLLAAEHILSRGNSQVILCERGIRTFENETRNTLALATIPLVKELSHLPIIVDPSHATGKRSLIASMTKASIAAGADGVMIDVHPHPEAALCDSEQALLPEEFQNVVRDIHRIAEAVDRT